MSTPSERARSIFLEAVEGHAPEQWPAFLDRACGDDDALRAAVERLLRARAELGSFHEEARPLAATTDLPAAEVPGTVVGPYKLVEQIGEGGMGSVWMAQQTEPVRRLVAVKLIKPGMDSRQVLARFEAERQALALMDHPNIAKVLDAGTTEAGRPYFVMDLVKGVPITRYCDEHHLTPRQRLELFVPVCQAIQHAHQKGIIHRDIKPSNVLVALYDGKPVPKVIDFGIAKAAGQPLTDKTLVTGFGAIVGTPEYMSPEQAEVNQLDIDTRSDIYSLGVLLYELLTGSPPFTRKELEKAGVLEMLRVIREQEPSKPSTKLSTAEGLPTLAANRGTEPAKLTRLMRGELDWIVMRALEKDRNRRYETANGFAADVQRYLAGEAVLAVPPSAGYRFRKFARQNRRALVTAAVVGVALLAGMGAVAGSLGWVVRDREAGRVRTAAEVNQFLERAEALYEDNKLPEAVAEVEKARGVLEAGRGDEELGRRVRQWLTDLDTAARLDELRLEWYELDGRDWRRDDFARAFRDYGIDVEALPDEEVTARVAASRIKLDLVLSLGNWAARLRSDPRSQDPARWQRLLAVVRAADPDPWQLRLRAAGEAKDLRTLRELVNGADLSRTRTRTLAHLGYSLAAAGDVEAAVAFLRAAQREHPGDFEINSSLASCLTQLKPPPWNEVIAFRRVALGARPRSAWAHNALASALQHADRLDEAVAQRREAVRLRPGVAYWHNNLGYTLRAQKKLDEAIACLKKAIELDPTSVQAYYNLGGALHDQKKLDEAVACYKKAIDLDPKNATVHQYLGNALLDQKKPGEAIACYKKAIELDPKHADAHMHVGMALRRQGKLAEAIDWYGKAIALDPEYAPAHYNLGNALSDQKRWDEAIACFRTAINLDQKSAAARNNLGSALYARGQIDEAVACYHKAIELDPNYAMAHYNLGNHSRDLRKLAEAITWYGKSVALDPEYAPAHYNLGITLDDQGKPDEAIASYKKAIAVDPKHVAAHHNIGWVLSRQGKVDEAIEWYRKALKLDTKRANGYIGLGDALLKKGQVDEAIACFHEATALDPKSAKAHNSLGNALKARGKPNEAIAAYRTAIELDRKFAIAYYNLGNVLLGQKKLNEAIDCYKTAIEIDPKDPDYYCDLGLALINQNKFDEAIDWCKKAVAIDPKHARSHNNIGIALRRQNRLDEAVVWYKKAVALDPKDASFHYNLGLAFQALNKLDEAIAAYREAIRLKKDDPNAHNSLGWALATAGRAGEAIASFEEAIRLQSNHVPAHSNLAWLLTAGPDPKVWDGKRAVELMGKVERFGGKSAVSRRLMGLAQYRAGNWKESHDALEEAMKLAGGGNGYHWFCLALAHHRLGDRGEARRWYDKAVGWMDENKPGDEMGELRRFRAEAASLLGVAVEVAPPPREKH